MSDFDWNDTPCPEMVAIMARLTEEDGHLPDPSTLPAAAGRAQMESASRRWNQDLPPMAEIAEWTMPGDGGPIRAKMFKPKGACGAILYIHGGGWAFYSIDTHERAMRCMAEATGMAIIGIDYRLAPEHPYPAGLEDVVAAWRGLPETLASLGINGTVGISGDSSGANLAIALMLHEEQESRPKPHFGLLFYGVYGIDCNTDSHRRFGQSGYGLTSERMDRYRKWYVPDPTKNTLSLVSPLAARDDELLALPPLYFNAAGLDPLLNDTLLLAKRLAGLGRKDQVRVHRGVIHGFMQMTTALTEARTAFAEAAVWAKRFIDTEQHQTKTS